VVLPPTGGVDAAAGGQSVLWLPLLLAGGVAILFGAGAVSVARRRDDSPR
jgi:hypothetical protein